MGGQYWHWTRDHANAVAAAARLTGLGDRGDDIDSLTCQDNFGLLRAFDSGQHILAASHMCACENKTKQSTHVREFTIVEVTCC